VLILTARDDKQRSSGYSMPEPTTTLQTVDWGAAGPSQGFSSTRKGRPQPLLSIGDLEVNLAERTVKRAGKPVELMPMEISVLEYLASRSRAVVSKTELLEHL